MSDEPLRANILKLLTNIAPELDPSTLDASLPLREQVDLDSMDFLNFVVAISKSLRVDIPESDYEKLRTLNDLVGYLSTRLPAT